MAQPISKENMVIVIREYPDNNGGMKKIYKTIGEITTWPGENGKPNRQSFELWGPTGSTQGNVFSQDNNQQAQATQQQNQNFQNQAPQAAPNQAPQAPQQGYGKAPQQGGGF